MCGGLYSSAGGRSLCGMALPQVKFLGVVEMIPGVGWVRIICTLYVTVFSYLSLQYHSLSLPYYSLHVHIPRRLLITQVSFSVVPAAIFQLHCILLSSCALLLPLSIMCRYLACYHYTCTMNGLISHLFLSHQVHFGDYSIFKILDSILLGLTCYYHSVIPSCQRNVNIKKNKIAL